MRWLFMAMFPVCVFFLISSTYAKEHICTNQPEVVVISETSEDIRQICMASGKAIIYLFHLDLLPKRTIRIEVTDEPLSPHGTLAYGTYNAVTDKIKLMSYSAIFKHSKEPRIFGEKFDRVHYTGAVAHEVAHAVMQQNIATKRVSTSSQEYLAYATQLRVMPAERRAVILQNMNVDGWMVGDSISELYLAIEPGRFAAKSYLHLNSLPDPTLFVKILLKTTMYYVYVPELRTIQ